MEMPQDTATATVWVVANAQAWGCQRDPDALTRVVATLRAARWEPQVTWTTSADAAEILVRQAVAQGVSLVVAAGGDGTVSTVARSLAGTRTALGILPLGTMNNLAQSVGIPPQLDEALRVLVAGEQRRISVGVVGEEIFLEAVSIGVEAQVFPLGEAHRHQGLPGVLRLLGSGWRLWQTARAFPITLDLDGRRLRRHAWSLSVVNAPRYGLGLMPTPLTQLDDAVFEVILVRPPSRWGLLRHYGSILSGRRGLSPRTLVLRARQITIASASPLPVAVDGRSAGTTPVTLRLWPEALTVVAPPPTQPLPPPPSLALRLRQALAPRGTPPIGLGLLTAAGIGLGMVVAAIWHHLVHRHSRKRGTTFHRESEQQE